MRIPGREVVRGDAVIIAEGDRVPADGVVLSSTNLTVDESLLTGESVPVRKCDWDQSATIKRPGGDDEPFVYSGTLVVQGQAHIEDPNHRHPHRDREDRAIPADARGREDHSGEGNSKTRPQPGHHGRLSERPRGSGLRAHQGRLAARHSRGSRAGDGHAAGGVSGSPYNLPGNGRVANIAEARARKAHARDRDSGLGHGPVRRQDRNADTQPDVGRPTLCQQQTPDRGGRWPARSPRGLPRPCRIQHTGEPARPVRPDGEGIPQPGREASGSDRAYPPRLGPGPAVSTLKGPAGDVACLEVRERRLLRHSRQGRPRGDCRSVPLRRTRKTALSEQIGAMAEEGLRVLAVARARFISDR